MPCGSILQSFAKSFLDVADNLGRASSVTKESFNKIDISEDTVGAVPLLKSLLEGVEMTEKQLAEVTSDADVGNVNRILLLVTPDLYFFLLF